MFNSFDINGNGFITFEEVEKGFQDLGKDAEPIFNAKKAMH